MPSTLVIKSDLWNQVVADVENRLPEEACGLLAGRGNQVFSVMPVENTYHSPFRYRMDPQEQLSAFQFIELQNMELLAIYHSHPDGPGQPSNTDISEAYYPDVVYIIVARDHGIFLPRAFTISNGQAFEISFVIEN